MGVMNAVDSGAGVTAAHLCRLTRAQRLHLWLHSLAISTTRG
jgi:hypothetical protein